MKEKILVLDFGSQYTQLIARRVRELNVYCEIHPFNDFPEINNTVKGIILSGSPFSVRDNDCPILDLADIKGNIPILGICYGAQLIAFQYGGNVLPSVSREYGRANLNFIDADNLLFKNIEINTQVWMSHGDTISELPASYKIIASTSDVKIGAYKIENEDTYGIQFHPEVYHTTQGIDLLYNFLVSICKCSQSWTPASFVKSTTVEAPFSLQGP